MADRQEAGGRLAPAHGLGSDQRPQPGEAEAVATRCQRAGGGVAGANQDAEVLAALAVADGDGFAAGEVADERAQGRRQLQLFISSSWLSSTPPATPTALQAAATCGVRPPRT